MVDVTYYISTIFFFYVMCINNILNNIVCVCVCLLSGHRGTDRYKAVPSGAER